MIENVIYGMLGTRIIDLKLNNSALNLLNNIERAIIYKFLSTPN